MLARLRILRMSYLTITHVGCSSGNAMRPTTAVTAMSSGLFTFQRNRTASDAAEALDGGPIDCRREDINVVGSLGAEVDVIGVLVHIERENRRAARQCYGNDPTPTG